MRRSMLTAAKVLTAKTLGWWNIGSSTYSSTTSYYMYIEEVPCPWTGYAEFFDSHLYSGGTYPNNYYAACILSKSGSNFTVKSVFTDNSASGGLDTIQVSNSGDPATVAPIKAGEYIGWFQRGNSGTSLKMDGSQATVPGYWIGTVAGMYPAIGEVIAGSYVTSLYRPLFQIRGKGA